MAKAQTAATLSPRRFATGGEVYAEHATAVAEHLNWVFGYRPVVYLDCTTGAATWTTSGLAVLSTTFRASAYGFARVLLGKMRVSADVQTIRVGARCIFAAAEGGSVKFTVGATNTTITFTDADNGTEKTATVDTASTGTGLLTWKIEIDQTAGVLETNMLRNVRIEAQTWTSALPDPAGDYVATPRQELVTSQNISGTDTAMTDVLNFTPISSASVVLFRNRTLLRQGATFDYTVSGTTITWLGSSGTAPNQTTSDEILALYWS